MSPLFDRARCTVAIVCTGLIFNALAGDKALVTNGETKVTAEDFEAFLLRVPEAQRAEFRASLERVTKAVELIYTNRTLANEARRLGYDKDPLIALRGRQLEEGYLAQVWQTRHQAEMASPDMVERARDIYRLNPDRFREPERLSGEYLQISLVGRTRETALARAHEARDKWLAGESFAQIAALYSDDALFPKTRGRFEQVTPGDLEKPIAEAAFALSKPGEISQPVESGPALHMVRLEKKTPSRLRSFDEVKSGLIASEIAQFKGLETDRRIGELKNTERTKIHDANILELVAGPPVAPAAGRTAPTR
jgi:peptidyl-prolyl cis-trans isomerase C